MNFSYHPTFGISLLVALLVVSPVGIVRPLADPMPADRAELDAHIRDYILSNPKVIRDALLKLESDEETVRNKNILRGFNNDIYNSGSPEIGDPAAKVTIVEFYDYNCPYCRATYPQLKAFLKANPDTKLLLKDIASLGKESEGVSYIVGAARQQGKFEALHDALMMGKGKVTGAQAIEMAAKLGLDVERLKQDARSSETKAALTRAQDLATRLSVQATPVFIVGHNGIAGAPDDLIEQITKYVEGIRKSGCDVC